MTESLDYALDSGVRDVLQRHFSELPREFEGTFLPSDTRVLMSRDPRSEMSSECRQLVSSPISPVGYPPMSAICVLGRSSANFCIVTDLSTATKTMKPPPASPWRSHAVPGAISDRAGQLAVTPARILEEAHLAEVLVLFLNTRGVVTLGLHTRFAALSQLTT